VDQRSSGTTCSLRRTLRLERSTLGLLLEAAYVGLGSVLQAGK